MSHNVDFETFANYVYSTEEHAVGRWIDGKLIYRKVITGPTTNDKTNTIDTGILSSQLNEILPMTCGVITSRTGGQWSLRGSDGEYGYRLEVNKGTSTVAVDLLHTYGAWGGGTIKIVIYYTKKTD